MRYEAKLLPSRSSNANCVDIRASVRKNGAVRRCLPWCSSLLISGAVFAQAQEPEPLPLDLVWQGPETCTGTSQTIAEIRRMISSARPLANATRVAVAVEARLTSDGKWAIRLATVSGERTGERQLRAETCDEARRAVALLVALMLDPQAHVADPVPQKTTSEQSLPTADTGPEKDVQPERKAAAVPESKPNAPLVRTSLDPVRGCFGAHLAADNGTLPSIDIGARLLLGVKTREWQLVLRAGGWLNRNSDYSAAPGTGVRLGLFDAELAACGIAVHKGAGSLQLCAGPRLYAFHASSYGVSSPASVTHVWSGGFGELAFLYRVVHGVVIRLGVQALVPFQRPRFAIADLGFVYQPHPIAERVSLGPEVEF